MAVKSHICLLGLIIICSSLTGTTAETDLFRSSGENVALPFNIAVSDCTSTTWIYSKHGSSVAVELFAGGIKKNNIERAERLSLGSDCSLNIYKITEDDRGYYTCRQYVKGKKQGNDAHVFLHVLHVSSSSSQTEIKPGSSFTLSCQLLPYNDSCNTLVHYKGIQLSWVNQADIRYQISQSEHCIITLTTTLLNEDNNTEWRCLVKNMKEIKTSASYSVRFRGPSDTNYEKTSTINASETEDSKTRVSLYRVIIVIVEITAFAAPTVILLQIICTERAENRKKTQTSP